MRSQKAGVSPAFFFLMPLNMMSHPIVQTRSVITCFALGVLCNVALAKEEVVTLLHSDKIAITTMDIQADSLRMPTEMRPMVLSNPQTVTQIASNLYARRAMAQRAEQEGLEKDPAVVAALKVARDKVLSDALIEKMDKANAPDDAAALSMARNIYRAKPERFKVGEQVQISHILISGTEAASRAQAQKLLEDIKAGADFAKLAEERSADKGSAAKGGDLGLFARGRMVPEFETVAFAMDKVGDVSDVVETKFGYHILKLTGKKPESVRTFEEVKDELVKEVRNNIQQDARVAEAQKLQQGAIINKAAIEAYASGFKPAR